MPFANTPVSLPSIYQLPFSPILITGVCPSVPSAFTPVSSLPIHQFPFCTYGVAPAGPGLPGEPGSPLAPVMQILPLSSHVLLSSVELPFTSLVHSQIYLPFSRNGNSDDHSV